MQDRHEKIVEAQFGPRAKAYVESAVHARGADLDALAGIVESLAPRRALDLGAGGGHVSYLLAAHAGEVVAADLSSEMLAAVAATAREKGLGTLRTVEAAAEALPFDDGAFDFLCSRFSAHHWRDWERGLREARRVLEQGSRAVFIDAVASATALYDTHLQVVEVLRDPSHVRDYSVAEWTAALGRAGFAAQGLQTWRLRMDFPVWTARMATPDANAAMIRTLQAAASAETRAFFAIEDDGSFLLDVAMIEAVAA